MELVGIQKSLILGLILIEDFINNTEFCYGEHLLHPTHTPIWDSLLSQWPSVMLILFRLQITHRLTAIYLYSEKSWFLSEFSCISSESLPPGTPVSDRDFRVTSRRKSLTICTQRYRNTGPSVWMLLELVFNCSPNIATHCFLPMCTIVKDPVIKAYISEMNHEGRLTNNMKLLGKF